MFVALVIQHAMRMRHIVLVPVACLALPYFTRLSHTGNDFRGGGVTDPKMCFDFLYNLTEIFLILRRIRDTVTNVHKSSRKVRVFLLKF